MSDENQPIQVNRRVVLAAAAATGVVAACGTGNDTGDTDTDAGNGNAVESNVGAVVTTTSAVPVKGGAINSQEEIVVTQPTEGDFRAFSSICPHQGCQVSEVSNNAIVCRCHGSRFSAETGDVEAGPARTGLAPRQITVEGDSIVLS